MEHPTKDHNPRRTRRRTRSRTARRISFATGVAALLAAGGVAVIENAQAASTCSDVEVVFARGTGEAPGLGILGTPLVSGIKTSLSGRSVTSYAVNYPADFAQAGDGTGATDLTNHVTATAASCPGTQFVIGGYSQGASVVDIAFGVGGMLGSGSVLPTSLADRIRAVTVFGNPLRMAGSPLSSQNIPVRARVLDQCNTGDPVCGAGVNGLAHLTYATNGSVPRAVRFAAARLG